MHCFNTIVLLIFWSCVSLAVCDHFYYFGYGSNLSGKRLKISSPSAEYYEVGVLADYRLDFDYYYDDWDGACATIVEDPGASVTGVLWRIDYKDLPNLDVQEELDLGRYYAKNVTVTTLSGEEVGARTYIQTVNPPKLAAGEDLPPRRRPSNTYLEVLIFGAVESGLPSDYIGYLVSFPTNGKQATDPIRTSLGYPYGPGSSSNYNRYKLIN